MMAMMLKVLEGRPAKMGFRMPAEWEPHELCWMGWPDQVRNWAKYKKKSIKTSPIQRSFMSPSKEGLYT